ncbi:MAG: response regulator [Planctomycetes bacterium]|nr:response regulator [Planctomycetota bacterium]
MEIPDLELTLPEDKITESILVVDDDQHVRELLLDSLQSEGFEVSVTGKVSDARSLIDANDYSLVITDVIMAEENGIDLLSWCRQHHPEIPFIIMTGFAEADYVVEALNLNAHSFVKKPFRLQELLSVVKEALSKRRYERMHGEFQETLTKTNKELRQKVIDAIVEHEKLFLGTLQALAQIIDARDPYTQQHSKSVALLSKHVAMELKLSSREVSAAEIAGALHDIGKIGVPESILTKPGRLTFEEMEIMKQHPARSANILKTVPGMEHIIPVLRAHHERYDGCGYPDGLQGKEIPLLSRILSVCDTWDAMVSDRPYRKALSEEKAKAILIECKGTQLDPEIVDAFLRCLPLDMAELAVSFSSEEFQ